MKKTQKKGWKWSSPLLAFLLPFGGMLIVMLVNGYHPFGRSAMLYSDAYHQYYPFFVAFRKALLEGDSLLHSWAVGMGVDYLGLIAYYLASPLNLLSVLVPDSQVLNYFCMLVPIKLGLAGLFFSLFLKKLFERNDFSVCLFGAFYALCAWALGYQWNVMWLDTFALLPLVMLGMVRLLRDRKFVLYTFALFLSVFSNYYIGLFTCFFVFLTFFCYEICRPGGWKKFFADFIRIGCFSVLAIGMTAVLTVSAMAALQTTQSSVNTFPTAFRLNIVSRHDIWGLLDAMRQVAGNMGGCLEPTFKEGLPNLYCGVGSIFLAILFLLSGQVKLRDKLCAVFLLLFFNVSFIIRQLDYIWHGFHFTNMIPYRFSFLYSFVILYMAYRAWLNRRKYVWLQITAAGLMTAALLCCSNSALDTTSVTVWGRTVGIPVYIIYNAGFLTVYVVIMLWNSIRPRLRENTKEELHRVRRVVGIRRTRCRMAAYAAMALELAATLTAFGCYFPGTNVTNYPKGTAEAASMFRYLDEREANTLFYRAEVTHSQTLNDGALNGYSGISTFTSSANVRVTEFMRALGYGAKNTYNRYCFEESSPVANLFLNLKYMVERDGRDRSSSVFDEVHHYGSIGLYKNTAYLPLGFLTESKLARLDFSRGDTSFQFQNELFCAATGLNQEVWRILQSDDLQIDGTGVEVTDRREGGFSTYSNGVNGGCLIYSFVTEWDGFACVWLDLSQRNDFRISVNGRELYQETISLPQMLAVQDVEAGDVIDVCIITKAGESGSAAVKAAVLDNEAFRVGYELLRSSCMELTDFSSTRVEGAINCNRDGLLYTSIPQNGNWVVYVDGEETEPTLIGDCMIGVELTGGMHSLSFLYRNKAFLAGKWISIVCTAVFVLLATAVALPRKQKKPEPEETKALPIKIHFFEQAMPKLNLLDVKFHEEEPLPDFRAMSREDLEPVQLPVEPEKEPETLPEESAEPEMSSREEAVDEDDDDDQDDE